MKYMYEKNLGNTKETLEIIQMDNDTCIFITNEYNGLYDIASVALDKDSLLNVITALQTMYSSMEAEDDLPV